MRKYVCSQQSINNGLSFSLCRWPLIIDPHQQCSTFLRYRDTNYMNALLQKDMRPQAIRLAIIGALRLAKHAVCPWWEGQHESKISDMYSAQVHAAFSILYICIRRYVFSTVFVIHLGMASMQFWTCWMWTCGRPQCSCLTMCKED